jgi:ABC-type transport system involved in Fe-S cluster assembly fused permease/ATPase subunit
LRKNIGIVLQETFLFNGTIYENICYTKPNASREEVIMAFETPPEEDDKKKSKNADGRPGQEGGEENLTVP